MAASASSISARLRRDGFRPVSPSDRNREGLRVTGCANGRIRVAADLDRASEARQLSFEALDALQVSFLLERSCAEVFYVVGPRPD